MNLYSLEYNLSPKTLDLLRIPLIYNQWYHYNPHYNPHNKWPLLVGSAGGRGIMATHAVRRTFSAGREAASRTRSCVPEGRHVLAGAHVLAAGFGREERRQPGQNHTVRRHRDSTWAFATSGPRVRIDTGPDARGVTRNADPVVYFVSVLAAP